MPSLKSLRVRIASVKATQKITKAMKMVAASKLRRAQDQAEAARPYSQRLERMVASLAASVAGNESAPAMLRGTGRDKVHLLVVATSDRGLCGGFNSAIVRAARRHIAELHRQDKTVKLFLVGRKGRDQLRRDFRDLFVANVDQVGAKGLRFDDARGIAERLAELFEQGAFDVCTLIYSEFRSVVSQVVRLRPLIPLAGGDTDLPDLGGAVYEFEPSEERILEEILPLNVAVQVYRALLENAAGEQGSRMMAMDSATRNAGDMIERLTLTYNRTRQAVITKELIEIISGAEAL